MAAKETLFLTIVGVYSLFPLLHPTNLLIIKLTLWLSYVLVQLVSYRTIFDIRFNILERVYCLGFGPLFFYTEIVHHQIPVAVNRLPFLPLLLTSVYCAVGVTYFWLTVSYKFVAVRVGGEQLNTVQGVTKTSIVTKTEVTRKEKKNKEGKREEKVIPKVQKSKATVTKKVHQKTGNKTKTN